MVNEAGNEVIRYYVYGLNGIVASFGAVADGGVTFPLKDHLGSARLVVNSTVSPSWYDYKPFGGVLRSNTNTVASLKYQYRGQELDKETDLYNYRARFYDTETGRFLGTDRQGQFFSPYVGIGNNPVNFTDPDGEWIAPLVGALVGGYVAGSISAYNDGDAGWANPGMWDANDWAWAGAVGGAFVGQALFGGASITTGTYGYGQQVEANIRSVFKYQGHTSKGLKYFAKHPTSSFRGSLTAHMSNLSDGLSNFININQSTIVASAADQLSNSILNDELIDLSKPSSGQQIADIYRMHRRIQRKMLNDRVFYQMPYLEDVIDITTGFKDGEVFSSSVNSISGWRNVQGQMMEIQIWQRKEIKSNTHSYKNSDNQLKEATMQQGESNRYSGVYNNQGVTIRNGSGAGVIQFRLITVPTTEQALSRVNFLRRLHEYLKGK
jgi:RHS repeat-associated protein